MCSQKGVSDVTPVNVNLEGVQMSEGVTPVSQMTGEPNKCVVRETVVIQMTNAGLTEFTSTLDSITKPHMSRKPSLSSQSNVSCHPVTPEMSNQGNADATPPVKLTLDSITETAVVNN